jgi:uncharacterized repeat protein (TIGR03803 family)
MRQCSLFSIAATIAAGQLAVASPAHAQATYSIVHSFTGAPTGPRAGLIQGSDGTLYGTTSEGGTANLGTIFQMAPDGSGFTLLHSFSGAPADGTEPRAGLIQGPDGTLYGTTYYGGSADRGTVFRLAPDGSGFTLLHSFTGAPTDGQYPYASLLQGPDGTLYGTTAFGGSADGGYGGTVFQMAPDGSGFTLLHSFTGAPADGAQPRAGLIQGPDGTLYGTTVSGGSAGGGTVFQMAPDGGGFMLLHSFNVYAEGGLPYSGLIQGPDGTLYGTTSTTNRNGFPVPLGMVFRLAPDGSGFTVLHSFTGDPDGRYPSAGLIQGPDDTLYGTTYYGGSARGTVFRLAPDGSGFTLLHSFTGAPTDGQNPSASLIQGPDGTLYGTTAYGGSVGIGTVFQMAPDGNGFTLLHGFDGAPADGTQPRAGLIQGPDGTLYGTTSQGGSANLGTVFQMASDGSGFTVLHSFTGAPTDGQSPLAGLIQDLDGTLYGTTSLGGTANLGTVFRLAPDGSGFTLLHSFSSAPTDGQHPYAGLIQGPDGTLYGTTYQGGSNGNGTVFRLAPDGSGFTLLHRFTGTDGGAPSAGLIQGPDGTLYGTTFYGGFADRGTVFQMAPDGGGFTLLHSFTDAPTDGRYPYAGLIQGPDGTLFGTTLEGGSAGSTFGTVFQMAPDGSGFTLLHSFTDARTDGQNPYAGLIQGLDGTLYGTTSQGGSNLIGTVFRLAPDGSGFTLLHTFTGAPDGQSPYAGLIQGPDGTLYGTTSSGGYADQGTIFQLVPDGSGFPAPAQFHRRGQRAHSGQVEHRIR